jgi:hypothetical protein
MASRITFRGRGGREHFKAALGDPGFAAQEQRFELVKGWLTGGTDPADGSVECGDGTHYPLEVTAAQLAEIFYRVKDSKLTGSVTETYDGTSSTLGFSGTPDTALVFGTTTTDYDWFSRRGYSTTDVTGYAGIFGSVYTVSGGSAGSGNFYDVGDDERAMWLPSSTAVNFNGPSAHPTGFSHDVRALGYGILSPAPSWYHAYHDLDGNLFGGGATLEFNGQVAWLDDNASGNPLDPLNRRFLGVRFVIGSSAYYTSFFDTLGGGASLAGSAEFELELSNSVVLSCPLYTGVFSEDYTCSGSIRAVATKWWPYKTTAGDPAWNTTTGAAANGGPGA